VTNGRMKVAELAKKGAAYNPGVMTPEDLEALRASMKRYGVVQSVVFNTRTQRVVDGHHRIQVAVEEGLAELDVRLVDLDEHEEKALNIALRRIRGGWDTDKLANLVHELRRAGGDLLKVSGLGEKEVELLLKQFDIAHAGKTDPNKVPPLPPKAKTKEGDLYLLGQHRLLCGDAAKPETLTRLLDGEPVHLVNTDPPYNVCVEPAGQGSGSWRSTESKERHTLQKKLGLTRDQAKGLFPDKESLGREKDRALANDFLKPEEFEKLLLAWFTNAATHLVNGRTFYIWGGFANLANYPPAIAAAGLFFAQCVIWKKNRPVITRKDFMCQHEQCFYGWKKGAAHVWLGPKNIPDVWEVNQLSQQKMVHLTEKPVELAERALTYSSRPGENVLDLFGGSGSTLIAAEQLDRRAFLTEIDPRYCDVIVKRWEEFTGKKAQLLDGSKSRRKGK